MSLCCDPERGGPCPACAAEEGVATATLPNPKRHLHPEVRNRVTAKLAEAIDELINLEPGETYREPDLDAHVRALDAACRAALDGRDPKAAVETLLRERRARLADNAQALAPCSCGTIALVDVVWVAGVGARLGARCPSCGKGWWS